ncbi:dihydrofolate reductase family protein [Dactylosporangium fulvum]|uniref:Dihydrofolate reductase family protein n=1 Tax=Dactylosporangium fulvum TaxID=53359 RepID=A0ABY5VUZ9_9ACTN|nr:dihydrofolate reductase family protein [Dactylosporangium fulvum]UWP80964.1 dihydrofolate reductase family protein [Dactylosporangium fulvum]
MRRIIASTYTTVDGFIDNPHEWSLSYNAPAAMQYALDLTLSADTLLLGRITYEGMAQAWPNMGGNPYADHVNAMHKYVVASQPVDTSAWNPTTVIAGDELLTAVKALKETDGTNILIWGNGRLTDALATAGLLDEYKIWTYPVLKGSGEPLFRTESPTGLQHFETTTFESGVVVSTYRVTTA